MRRRDFITLVVGAIVTWPFAAMAQEAGDLSPLVSYSRTLRVKSWTITLYDELGRRGLIKGQNLAIDCRDFGPHFDSSSEYAAELINAHVDVIVAYGQVAIRAAQQVTKTIPILGVTDDMLGEGLVNSLARPEGNTTGCSILATELNGKRQEILIEAVPGFRLWELLPMPMRRQMQSFTPCKRRRAHMTSSFQFIGSPKARRSRQLSIRRGRGRHSAQRFGVTDAQRQ